MIEYLYGEEDELLPWAAAKISPMHRFRSDAKAIGMVSGGRVRAVVAYDTFSDNDCRVHLASDGKSNWMTREFAVRAMAYPFIQCNFTRISSLNSILNRPALQFALRFGWVKEGVQREAGWEGEDLLILGMLRRECRWLAVPETPPLSADTMPANTMAV